jgi:hypothetical protein
MIQMLFNDMEEFKKALLAIMIELNAESEKAKNISDLSDKLYTVNQVRKRLGKAHSTIGKLIAKGMIKTTKDGLISEASLREYLQKN